MSNDKGVTIKTLGKMDVECKDNKFTILGTANWINLGGSYALSATTKTEVCGGISNSNKLGLSVDFSAALKSGVSFTETLLSVDVKHAYATKTETLGKKTVLSASADDLAALRNHVNVLSQKIDANVTEVNAHSAGVHAANEEAKAMFAGVGGMSVTTHATAINTMIAHMEALTNEVKTIASKVDMSGNDVGLAGNRTMLGNLENTIAALQIMV